MPYLIVTIVVTAIVWVGIFGTIAYSIIDTVRTNREVFGCLH